MAIVGNASGVITYFTLSGTTLETAYELVVVMNDRLSIQWSLNDVYIVIGSEDGVIIVSRDLCDERTERSIPHRTSRFSIEKIIRDISALNDVSIDFESQYVAASGSGTWIL